MIELIKALIEAKKQFKAIHKDVQGHNYKYFDLSEIKEATERHLLNNGLLLVQNPIDGDKGLGIDTTIYHVSGESMKFEFRPPKEFVTVNQKGIQALGSIITYLKRYHQCAILNLAESDDDGASALPDSKPRVASPKPKPKLIKDHKEFLGLKAIVVQNKFAEDLNKNSSNGNWELLEIAVFDDIKGFVSQLVQKKQTEELRET